MNATQEVVDWLKAQADDELAVKMKRELGVTASKLRTIDVLCGERRCKRPVAVAVPTPWGLAWIASMQDTERLHRIRQRSGSIPKSLAPLTTLTADLCVNTPEIACHCPDHGRNVVASGALLARRNATTAAPATVRARLAAV